MQNKYAVVSGLSAILAFSSTYVHTSSSEDVLFNGKLLSHPVPQGEDTGNMNGEH
jgi:hypothetical protein